MRRKVKTRYQKAGSSPSTRQRGDESLTDTFQSSMSPLTRYIVENESTGISREELTEQFRELDCEHTRWNLLAESSVKKVYGCADCGRMEYKWKAAK